MIVEKVDVLPPVKREVILTVKLTEDEARVLADVADRVGGPWAVGDSGNTLTIVTLTKGEEDAQLHRRDVLRRIGSQLRAALDKTTAVDGPQPPSVWVGPVTDVPKEATKSFSTEAGSYSGTAQWVPRR